MLGTLPQDSPRRGAVEQALAQSAKRSIASGEPAKGPSAAMSTLLRRCRRRTGSDDPPWLPVSTKNSGAIRAMRKDGCNSFVPMSCWARPIRRDALNRGVAAFGAESDEAKKLTALAASLGLTATE
jgi:cytochrome c-type biogenesis protein CcmH